MATASPFVELFRSFVASEEGLRFVLQTVEGLPMAVVLYDVSGPEPVVMYRNQVARPVGVATPGDVTGLRAEEVFPHSGVDQARWVRQAFGQGESLHVSEYETGDHRIWEADIHPIERAGAPSRYVLLMAVDVTAAVLDRRRAETDREEQAALLRETAARMVSLEKVKSDFLNLASHELRGPLAVLRGYLAMLGDGSLGDLPPQARAVLPTLNAKAGQIALLITQMLEAARLEDSRLQLKLEPVDLCRLVRQAADTMGALTAPSQAIAMAAAPVEALVVADPVRVETIVVNLLDNALKYSPGGGEVAVAVTGDEGWVEVAVRDHGLGIAAQDIDRLFTRFGRLVTADNSHISGTGLGLYLSRELARMHGGDITVTSAPGQGSQFTLRLPRSGPEAGEVTA